MSINKVILVGNLGKDPEIRSMQNGSEIANFSLATSERWKSKSGEQQERTQWHNVVVFNEGLVKLVKGYVKKGMKLYVEGQLETRKWTDKSGNDKYTTEIVLRPYKSQITIVSNKNSGQNSGQNSGYNQAQQQIDDDIPF